MTGLQMKPTCGKYLFQGPQHRLDVTVDVSEQASKLRGLTKSEQKPGREL